MIIWPSSAMVCNRWAVFTTSLITVKSKHFKVVEPMFPEIISPLVMPMATFGRKLDLAGTTSSLFRIDKAESMARSR